MARIKSTTELDWLTLATRKDDGTRPVLAGIHVNAKAAATDGHRLHVTASQGHGLAAGLWNPKTLQAIEGTYPNYDMVLPKGRKAYREITDTIGALAQCNAAIAYAKTLSGNNGSREVAPYVSLKADDGSIAVFNAVYMADALKGWAGYPTPAVAISAPAALEPAHLKGSLGREALVMPMRSAANGGSAAIVARLTLDEYVGKAV